MADDTIMELSKSTKFKADDRATIETTLEAVESSYAEFRGASEDRGGRSDDYGFETDHNDFGYESGSDDIWGF